MLCKKLPRNFVISENFLHLNIQANEFFTEEWHDNNFEDLIKCIQKLIEAIKMDSVKNDKKKKSNNDGSWENKLRARKKRKKEKNKDYINR